MNEILHIKSWNDIKKHIHYSNYQCNFIEFYKENNKYILLQKDDIKNIEYNFRKCYLLPNGCIKNLDCFIDVASFLKFNSSPHYHIIDCLYKYKDNTEVCFLLSFTNIVYDIIKNEDYYIFMECKNFNKTFINFVMNHFLDICEDELLKKYKINHRCIYKQTKKKFSPRESFEYYYRYINQDIDVSKINSIIDYICFLIHQIKIEYDFIVVYNKIDSKTIQVLKNM